MAYEEIEGIYSQEEAEEKAEEKLNQIFINLFEKGVQIIEKDVRIDTMDGICMYTVDLTLQQPIGVEQIIDESQYTREDADDS
jgi:similar to stage IV sporulation protein